MKVRLVGEDGQVKDFVDLFGELMESYDKAPRERRRELYEILRKANRVKKSDFGKSIKEKAKEKNKDLAAVYQHMSAPDPLNPPKEVNSSGT